MDKSSSQIKLSRSMSTRLPVDKSESSVPAWRRRASPPTPPRTPNLARDNKFTDISRSGSKRGSACFSPIPGRDPSNRGSMCFSPGLWRSPSNRSSVCFSPSLGRDAISHKAAGSGLTRDSAKPGTIIRAPLHEQNWNIPNEFSEEDKSMTPSRYGPIHTKIRKMIIIICHEDHYVALPCFSHQGRGLERKSNPEEFVSIRDHRNTTAADFQALSQHTPLVTGELTEVTDEYHPSSIIRLTYPVSRPYPSSCVIEGRLTPESLVRLIKLYVKFGFKIPADLKG